MLLLTYPLTQDGAGVTVCRWEIPYMQLWLVMKNEANAHANMLPDGRNALKYFEDISVKLKFPKL